MKIGFFGGCFNPPTNAHINIARDVLDKCNIDKVIFVPMGDLYEKPGLAKAKDRYKMLEIACSEINNIEVSDLEINENRKLYAIDAFRLIEKNYANDDIFFIMGADNFIKLINWKESENLSKYNYIVIERDNINLKGYIEEHSELKKYNIKIIKNDKYKNYSATKFRNLLNGEKIEYQDIIQDEVLEFIIKNEIY